MISLLLSLTVTASAGTTTLSQLDPQALLFHTCELNAQEHEQYGDWTAALAAWESCLKDARRQELGDVQPRIDGRIILARMKLLYGDMQSSDPLGYSKVVLATVAQHPSAEFPVEVVRKAWLRLLQDNEHRHNSPIRSVTVRWMDSEGGTPEQLAQLDKLLRRHIGDMGFKLPAADSADAGKVDVMLWLQAELRAGGEQEYDEGILFEEFVMVTGQAPKFRNRDARGARIEERESVTAGSRGEARAQAIEAAAASVAEDLLLQVVRQLYTDYSLPKR